MNYEIVQLNYRKILYYSFHNWVCGVQNAYNKYEQVHLRYWYCIFFIKTINRN